MGIKACCPSPAEEPPPSTVEGVSALSRAETQPTEVRRQLRLLSNALRRAPFDAFPRSLKVDQRSTA